MTQSASDFAQLIAHYRQQRGMSQGQLAQATRLSRTYVYHLETGQRVHPSTHVVQNIARALELPGAGQELGEKPHARLHYLRAEAGQLPVPDKKLILIGDRHPSLLIKRLQEAVSLHDHLGVAGQHVVE